MGHCVFQSVVHPHRMFEPVRPHFGAMNPGPFEGGVPAVCPLQNPGAQPRRWFSR